MKNLVLVTFIFSILTILGCDKPEQIPAYLYIKPFEITTDYTKQGLNTSRITEAWVFEGSNLLGAFTLPAEVPILNSENSNIVIYAGIRNNGDNSTPDIYYHLDSVQINKKLIPGKYDTIVPKTNYVAGLNFRWIDDFETNSYLLNTNVDQNDSLNFTTTAKDVKYGQRCGLLRVNKKNPIMSVSTSEPFGNLPQKNRIFLELDYKSNVLLLVELFGINKNQNPKNIATVTYKAKNEWSKTYVNFSQFINTDYQMYSYVITALMPIESTETDGEVRVDNIKLIHP